MLFSISLVIPRDEPINETESSRGKQFRFTSPNSFKSEAGLGKTEIIMIRQFLKDESGQDIVEYSLLLVLIGAAAVLVLTGMGTSIGNIFRKIESALKAGDESIGGSGSGTAS